MDFKKRVEFNRFVKYELEHWTKRGVSLTFMEYLLLRLIKVIEDEIEDNGEWE